MEEDINNSAEGIGLEMGLEDEDSLLVPKPVEIHIYLTDESKLCPLVDIQIHDSISNETTIIFVGDEDNPLELAKLYLEAAGLSNAFLDQVHRQIKQRKEKALKMRKAIRSHVCRLGAAAIASQSIAVASRRAGERILTNSQESDDSIQSPTGLEGIDSGSHVDRKHSYIDSDKMIESESIEVDLTCQSEANKQSDAYDANNIIPPLQNAEVDQQPSDQSIEPVVQQEMSEDEDNTSVLSAVPTNENIENNIEQLTRVILADGELYEPDIHNSLTLDINVSVGISSDAKDDGVAIVASLGSMIVAFIEKSVESVINHYTTVISANELQSDRLTEEVIQTFAVLMDNSTAAVDAAVIAREVAIRDNSSNVTEVSGSNIEYYTMIADPIVGDSEDSCQLATLQDIGFEPTSEIRTSLNPSDCILAENISKQEDQDGIMTAELDANETAPCLAAPHLPVYEPLIQITPRPLGLQVGGPESNRPSSMEVASPKVREMIRTGPVVILNQLLTNVRDKNTALRCKSSSLDFFTAIECLLELAEQNRNVFSAMENSKFLSQWGKLYVNYGHIQPIVEKSLQLLARMCSDGTLAEEFVILLIKGGGIIFLLTVLKQYTDICSVIRSHAIQVFALCVSLLQVPRNSPQFSNYNERLSTTDSHLIFSRKSFNRLLQQFVANGVVSVLPRLLTFTIAPEPDLPVLASLLMCVKFVFVECNMEVASKMVSMENGVILDACAIGLYLRSPVCGDAASVIIGALASCHDHSIIMKCTICNIWKSLVRVISAAKQINLCVPVKWVEVCIESLQIIKAKMFCLQANKNPSEDDSSQRELDGNKLKKMILTSLDRLAASSDSDNPFGRGNDYSSPGSKGGYLSNPGSKASLSPIKEVLPIPEYSIPNFSPLSDYRSAAEMREGKKFKCQKLSPEEKEQVINAQSQLLACGNRMLMFSTRFAVENILSDDFQSPVAKPIDVSADGSAAEGASANVVENEKLGFADKLSAMIESVRLLNEMYC